MSEHLSTQMGSYYLLGNSGLRVSPLCLGTMTFGTEWGWGSDAATAASLYDRFLDAGGNFVDTADLYTEGESEKQLGTLMAERGQRDRLVVATKFSFSLTQGDPNAGGNGRKHIVKALEASLRRLKTDYVDLYWLHIWDTLTPVEEVMRTLDDLVRAGKIRYVGFSDVPAWYAARAQTLAEWRGTVPLCALQLEYSLAERSIEREHIPAALELGMAVQPWSPLAGGLLTGKYRKDSTGRLATQAASGGGHVERFTERNARIVEVLCEVAAEVEKTPAQVALNWVAGRRGIAATLIGATRLSQLEDNLAALSFTLPNEARSRLDAVSAPDDCFPYSFFTSHVAKRTTGHTNVQREAPAFRGPRVS